MSQMIDEQNTEEVRWPLLKVSEVAQILGISQSGTRKLIATGELPSLKIRSSRRVSMTALNAFIAELEEQGSEE